MKREIKRFNMTVIQPTVLDYLIQDAMEETAVKGTPTGYETLVCVADRLRDKKYEIMAEIDNDAQSDRFAITKFGIRFLGIPNETLYAKHDEAELRAVLESIVAEAEKALQNVIDEEIVIKR